MTGLVRAVADAPAHSPLLAATPAAWLEDACVHWRELLIDHANCEKKAASTALALIFAYPEERALALALSKLAREELRHFEQVTRLMVALGVPFARQRPGRYAQQLRAAICCWSVRSSRRAPQSASCCWRRACRRPSRSSTMRWAPAKRGILSCTWTSPAAARRTSGASASPSSPPARHN
jgi:tRNA-(MS[2]IO[6]A)-hydroxylase (MiaE)